MSDVAVKPWKIEQNASGFVYVTDYNGNKICTVYGTDGMKIQRAMAISALPVLVAELAKMKDEKDE